MNIADQINAYIDSQESSKRKEMQTLHGLMLQWFPQCTLCFLDGKNDEGKVVSNPNIGYGSFTMHLAGGKTREFYRVGLSANTTGISVYIMGLSDKTFLTKTYAKRLGKASVTGYCIKFKTLNDIHRDVLEEAIRHGMKDETR